MKKDPAIVLGSEPENRVPSKLSHASRSKVMIGIKLWDLINGSEERKRQPRNLVTGGQSSSRYGPSNHLGPGGHNLEEALFDF